VLFMAIHHITPPVRGGERLRLPSPQVGPVTQAIRAMRDADPASEAFDAQFDANSIIQHAETASRFAAKSDSVSYLLATDAAIAAIREGVMRFLAEEGRA
jgi:hypothetical protein